MSEGTEPEVVDVVKRVDEFIERVHSLELIIDPKAREIWLGKAEGTRVNLSDHLAKGMQAYAYAKSWKSEDDQVTKANDLHYYIEKAFACGVVSEGSGLPRKLEESKTKVAELTRDNGILASEVKQLQEEKKNFWKEKKSFKSENK